MSFVHSSTESACPELLQHFDSCSRFHHLQSLCHQCRLQIKLQKVFHFILSNFSTLPTQWDCSYWSLWSCLALQSLLFLLDINSTIFDTRSKMCHSQPPSSLIEHAHPFSYLLKYAALMFTITYNFPSDWRVKLPLYWRALMTWHQVA